MNTFKRILAIASIGLIGLIGRIALAQSYCGTTSAGGQIETTPNAILIVGQTAIGNASGDGIHLYAGGLHCLAMGITSVPCLPGDVDNNGVIDGRDIDEYMRVNITQTGTAQELCAANLNISDFVALLLQQ